MVSVKWTVSFKKIQKLISQTMIMSCVPGTAVFIYLRGYSQSAEAWNILCSAVCKVYQFLITYH